MWIRSQDRAKLIDAKEIHIEVWADKRSYIISDNIVVASYSSEKKALKVMDMIEDAIIEYETMMNNEDGFFNGRRIVFQMPRDNVVTAMMEM